MPRKPIDNKLRPGDIVRRRLGHDDVHTGVEVVYEVIGEYTNLPVARIVEGPNVGHQVYLTTRERQDV